MGVTGILFGVMTPYPVCGMVHVKDILLLIGKSSSCGGNIGFTLSLSEGSFTIRPTPCNR